MLTVLDYLEIRKAHASGESMRSIARRLGHCQKSVRRAIRSGTGEPPPYTRGRPVGYSKMGREAAEKDEGYESYLLKLTELEVNQRGANAVTARIKNASFPVLKDLETFDFTFTPQISKQKVLELSRCEWIEQKSNLCCVGNSGT